MKRKLAGTPKGGGTMKTPRYLGLALILMLLFGAIAARSYRASAQSGPTPEPQVQVSGAEDDKAEAPDGTTPDTDDIQSEEQGGPQDETAGAEGDNVQEPNYAGSISVDETQYEGMTEEQEGAALASLAKISAEDAKSAALSANPGATVLKVELDNENGAVVYSVELSSGAEVKIDAGTAVVLHTEVGGESEG
jgi:uncharacterized membrane protein YkoI